MYHQMRVCVQECTTSNSSFENGYKYQDLSNHQKRKSLKCLWLKTYFKHNFKDFHYLHFPFFIVLQPNPLRVDFSVSCSKKDSFRRFLQAYDKEGLRFWSLSGNNEAVLQFIYPLPAGTLNSTLMLAPEQRMWLKQHLKPLLLANNFTHIKFFGLEDERAFAPYWMEVVGLERTVSYSSLHHHLDLRDEKIVSLSPLPPQGFRIGGGSGQI